MRYIVLGGGIAGVSCGKELARLTAEEVNTEVFIITAAHLLKEVSDSFFEDIDSSFTSSYSYFIHF